MSQQPRQVPTHSSSPSKASTRRRTSGSGSGIGTGAGAPGSTQRQPPQPSGSTTAAATPPTTTTQSNARNLLPSPHFEDDPIVASHQRHSTLPRPSLTLNPSYSSDPAADDVEHDLDTTDAELLPHSELGVLHSVDPIPSFQPFFTLIEDTLTNEHHHPTVHYIFADDDADIITDAALRSLETLDPTQRAGGGGNIRSRGGHTAGDEGGAGAANGSSPSSSRLPPPIAGTREHYLILDVHPQPQLPASDDPSTATTTTTTTSATITGSKPAYFNYSITSSHSLSSEWQVLRSSISAAPTIAEDPAEEGLMLRIEGRGNTPSFSTAHSSTSAAEVSRVERGKGKDIGGEEEREKESMEELIERFQRRLEDIRTVMEVSGAPAAGGGEE